MYNVIDREITTLLKIAVEHTNLRIYMACVDFPNASS